MITALAIVRWLEIVEQFDTAPLRAEIKAEGGDPHCPGAILQKLWLRNGVSSNDVSGRVLTPLVRAAIRARAGRVIAKNAVLIIDDDKVITVIHSERRSRAMETLDRKRRGKTKNRLGRRTGDAS